MKKKNLNAKEYSPDKIQTISEIDQLKVVANNHFLMKKYYEAIKVSEIILSLAKKSELPSIIKEQEEFIFKISKLIDDAKIGFIEEDFIEIQEIYEERLTKDDLNGAHKVLEEFKKKYEKIIDLETIPSINTLLERDKVLWDGYYKNQKSLKGQLGPLEIQFSSFISTNNLNLAEETIKKAKKLLNEVKNDDLKRHWQDYEIKLIELKSNKNFQQGVKESLLNLSNYTDTYQFAEGRKIIGYLEKSLRNRNAPELIKQFELKKKAFFDSEEKYNKLTEEIEVLEAKVKNNLSNGFFSKAMSDCEQIIKVSRFIGRSKYVDMYSKLLNEIKSKMRKYHQFEEVKNIINSLKEEAIKALNNDDYEASLKLFIEMKDHLIRYSKV